jgi:NIPSNAP
MNRRSWMSWLGVSAAGSLAGLSAVRESQPNKPTWILSLESFRVREADQMPRLHSYLGGVFLSFLSQIHRGPKMFLEAIVAPHTPQALFLAAFPGFDEMIETRRSLAAHTGIQRALADLECGEGPVVEQARSQILITTRDSLRLHMRPTPRETNVFELRSYRAPAWRDRPPAAVHAALRRAGIHPILNASTAAGEHLPQFTYLIPFQSLAAREEAWARLDMDQEWISLQRESIGKYGSEAKVTSASIYSLAPYSPLS